MKKILAWTAITVLVIGGAIAVFWPNNFFRIFDANMQPLVLTEAEAYCSALRGMGSNFQKNDQTIPRCIKDLENTKDNETPSVANAVGWMCDGVLASGNFDHPRQVCVDILYANRLWMITTGGLTTAWNDAHPYPSAFDQGEIPDEEPTRGNRSEGVSPYGYDNTETSEEDNE